MHDGTEYFILYVTLIWTGNLQRSPVPGVTARGVIDGELLTSAVITEVLLKIKMLWIVTPCHWVMVMTYCTAWPWRWGWFDPLKLRELQFPILLLGLRKCLFPSRSPISRPVSQPDIQCTRFKSAAERNGQISWTFASVCHRTPCAVGATTATRE